MVQSVRQDYSLSMSLSLFSLLNYWSKLLTSFTSLISFFKLGVPLLTIIMLMLSGFDTSNYGSSIGEFMPYGSAPIFAATTTSGIIFSFNAFQTIINMGSEIKNPEKNIARGIAISLTLSAILHHTTKYIYYIYATINDS